ncbi:MAG TPA: peptidoglycan DD-metalloendopeptidase family protein [Magnetospirillaceae bacterium]|jgi:murein DD-endopeptidase MepM/ murein hydrolase activator NlpD
MALLASVAACAMGGGGPIRDANRDGGASAPAGAQPQRPPSNTYVAVAGDTIYVVARRYNISVRALIDANKLQPPFQLNPGDVLQLPTGGTYTVVKGDTLSAVSRKTGIEFGTLARMNNLSSPYRLRIGQQLLLPTGTPGVQTASADPNVIVSPNVGGQGASSFAPIEPMHVEALPQPNPPPKETTTFGSAQRPGLVTEAGTPTKTVTLTPAPGSSSSSSPQTLAPAPKPAAAGSTYQPLAQRDVQTAPAPAERTVLAEPDPAPPQAPAESPRMQSASPEPIKPPAAAAAANPGFIWPVKGPVLSSFGPTAKGQHNDGINIAVPKGTAVVAAGDGQVVYVGNELRGFGNLLLIKHTGTEYITAYANNDKILVRKGEHVTKGQKVALSGDTGGVGQPQLHFELRQGAKAIDPQSIMPNELSPAASQGARQDPG